MVAVVLGAQITGGQLGIGGTTSTDVPIEVSAPAGEYWRAVFSQDRHTCGLTNPSGTNWCWGKNEYGQLCLGDTADRTVPTQIRPAPPTHP